MKLTIQQQHMVEENMGLVRAVLSRCVSNPGSCGIYSYDDLFQIGCVGLCEAAMEYKLGRAAFSTYAYAAIRNRIYNALVYASRRRNCEISQDIAVHASTNEPRPEAEANDLKLALRCAQGKLSGVAKKGVDVMLLMSEGHSCKEIGKLYGTNANNITAWASKARKALRMDEDFLRFTTGLEA